MVVAAVEVYNSHLACSRYPTYKPTNISHLRPVRRKFRSYIVNLCERGETGIGVRYRCRRAAAYGRSCDDLGSC